MCWAMLHNTMCSTFNASQMFDFLACVESNEEHQINFLKEWQMPLQATASKKLKRGWIDKRSQEIKKLKSTIQLKSIEPHRQKLACFWPSGFFINMVDEPMAKWELFCQKAHTEKKSVHVIFKALQTGWVAVETEKGMLSCVGCLPVLWKIHVLSERSKTQIKCSKCI